VPSTLLDRNFSKQNVIIERGLPGIVTKSFISSKVSGKIKTLQDTTIFWHTFRRF
jgi:hypothetical protein